MKKAGFYKHITNSAQTEVGGGAELGKTHHPLNSMLAGEEGHSP